MTGCTRPGSSEPANPQLACPAIDFSRIPSPIILRGDEITACRDPAAHYHDGVFRVFHTLVRRENDGHFYWYVAVTKSRDLVHWSRPRVLTPRDRSLNFSSPGNVVRFGDQWLLCVQSYPTPTCSICATRPGSDDTLCSFTARRSPVIECCPRTAMQVSPSPGATIWNIGIGHLADKTGDFG